MQSRRYVPIRTWPSTIDCGWCDYTCCFSVPSVFSVVFFRIGGETMLSLSVKRLAVSLLWPAMALLAFLLARPALAADAGRPSRPNVLFIAVDDLRPELGCYGCAQIKSPNIDRLAERGTVFLRAYCQQAVCGPSRTSLLTGLRPDTTTVWGNAKHFREKVPDAVTLPAYFKKNRYHTQGMGKIFHGAFPRSAMAYYKSVDMHDPEAWSVPSWFGPPRYYFTPEGIAAARQDFAKISGKSGAALDEWVNYFCRGPATEAPEIADIVPYDGQLASQAVTTLRELRLQGRPFFLAVGFIRPHLPFIAPKKYWDLYDPKQIKLADNPLRPKGAPDLAMHNFGELRYYSDITKRGPVEDEKARKLIHGYYACVSYIDAQIGRVLDEVDRLGFRKNTIVCLWGDHGWHLGDHGLWCKHSNFETATRVPLIVCAPGSKAPGSKTKALVEFVDIYPSLADLAGLPAPKGLEGTSFAPLLDDPNLPGKRAALSQYPRKRAMGRSMRTDRYRFTLWQSQGKTPKTLAVELYDHQSDPQENENLAIQPEHAELVKTLTAELQKCWDQSHRPVKKSR